MLGYVTQIVDDHVIRACKGKWLVVINNWQGACAAADAGVNVIFRWHGLSGKEIRSIMNVQNPTDQYMIEKYGAMAAGDDNLCDKISAVDWVYIQSKLGRPDIWRYTCNESGLTSSIIRFHNDLISIPSNLKYVSYNLSTGTPNPTDLYLIENVLRWASAHPNRMKIGLHEYFYGAPYTACAGKSPMDWLPKANWPTKRPDVCWHMGRFQNLMEFSKEKGFPCPEIVITETGHDYLGDLAKWVSIPLQDGDISARGYKTLEEAWRQWGYINNQTGLREAYIAMLQHATNVMYKGSPVVGACIFRYDVGYGWGDFATGALLDEVSPTPVPKPEPEPEPPPTVDPDLVFAKALLLELGKVASQVEFLQKMVSARWK